MAAAILTVGTELTRGEVPNTHAPWLASRLSELGFDVWEIACVGDDRERIRDALRRLGARARVLIVTGGLGPTPDDLTVTAAADAAGVAVVRDPVTLEALRRKAIAYAKPLSASVEKLADIPEGAEILGNPMGLSCGFRMTIGQADCFFLPGNAAEMSRLYEETVVRRIVTMVEPRSYHVVLRTCGLAESVVAEKLSGIDRSFAGLSVAFRANPPEVDVKLTVRGGDAVSARATAERAAAEARTRLGDAVFGDEHDTWQGAVGRSLRARGYTLAVAESCTGGLIGAMLTAVPGSSDYLLLDAVTYSNASKEQMLGVPAEVLRANGAVSAETVRAMADGARRISGADLAVSVSGIAGPSGGSAEKPVGTVFFGLARREGTEVFTRRFAGDRTTVQRQAAFAALGLVRDACRGDAPAAPNSVCG